MSSTAKNYNAIDIARLVFAIFVVSMHNPIFGEKYSQINNFLNTILFNMAVPFFFIVSSFLFFSKCSEKEQKEKYLFKYEKRLIILYLIWCIIYIPNSSLWNSFKSCSIKIIAGELLFWIKTVLIDSPCVHLWYLNTLALCIAILFFVRKKLSPGSILVICFIICFFLSGLTSRRGELYISDLFFKFVPYIMRNTLRKGLICCSIGMYIAELPEYKYKSKPVTAFIILTAVEIIIFFSDSLSKIFFIECTSYIFSSLKAAAVFLILYQINLNDSNAYNKCRGFSSIIYCSHMLFGSIALKIAGSLHITDFLPESLARYFIVLILSFMTAYIVYNLSNINKLKFLKNIY